MTRTENRLPHAELQAILADIITELGVWRVLRAAARQALRRRHRDHRNLSTLNDHVLRDIGLNPYHPPPDHRTLTLWEGLNRPPR